MSDALRLPTEEFDELVKEKMAGVTGDLAMKAAGDVEAAIKRNLALLVGETDFLLAAILICQACSMKAMHVLASATSANNHIAKTGELVPEEMQIPMASWIDALIGSAGFLSVEQRVDIVHFSASKGWITDEEAKELVG